VCAVAASETRYGEKGDEKGHQQWPDAANLLMFRDQATEWWRTQSQSNPSPLPNSLLTGKRTGNFVKTTSFEKILRLTDEQIQKLSAKFSAP
jgi:hypothetical protein